MKKQLIIKIPKSAGADEIKSMIELNHKACYIGTPMFLFPDWEYEVVELSDPVLYCSEPNQDDIRKVMNRHRSGNVAQFD